MTDEARWLLDWFQERGPVPGNSLEEQLQVNYFEADLIDSLGLIDLVVEVEEHFGVYFNERHFQDRSFSTIQGLSILVSELSKADTQVKS